MIRRFLSYYGPQRNLLVLDLIAAILIATIDLAFPQVLRWVTNNLFVGDVERIRGALVLLAVGLFIMYAVRYAARYFVTAWGHIMGARMESGMRQDLFDQYQRFSFSYYDRTNTGEMMSKLVSDLFDIAELAHHGPENIIISVLKIIGSFILMAAINLELALVLGLITLVMMGYTYAKNRTMQEAFYDNRRKMADINTQLQDGLQGIRVVKSFANEDHEADRFASRNDAYLDSKERTYKVMGTYHAMNSAFTGLLYIVTIVFGGWLIIQGRLAAPDLAIFAIYIALYVGPIEILVNFTEQFQKGYSGFRRFIEVLDTKPEIVDAPRATELRVTEGHVRYEGVHFSYDGVHDVIDGLDLDVKPGRTIALVGPSGGGKTTTCALLPRFYDVDAGRITIDGTDIRDVTQRSLRDSIGVVEQDVYLFNGTIAENISYGKEHATREEIIAAARAANIHEFVMSTDRGYETQVGEKGAQLSGGQKQRVAIARVFLKDPRILILDEATSALDTESEAIVQQSLADLSVGRTTLVIAHRLSTIKDADMIVAMEDGAVAEQGTHDELMARDGIYARYYRMQFGD